MSIRSLFGRKDRVSSTSAPAFPKLPSHREMIDDIERIKNDDNLLALSAIIDKKGRHSVVDTDIKELADILKARKATAEGQGLNRTSRFSIPLLPSLRKGSASPQSVSNDKAKLIEEGASSPERALTYHKIQHFFSTCHHAQELLANLEPDLMKLEKELKNSDQGSSSCDIPTTRVTRSSTVKKGKQLSLASAMSKLENSDLT